MATNKSYNQKSPDPKNFIIYLAIAAVLFGLVYFFLIENNNYGTLTKETTNYSPPPKQTIVNLTPQNNSGLSGTAALVEINGQTKVSISLTNAPKNVVQPAHIHMGACPGVGAVKYPLTNVVNGKSETLLDVTQKQLKSEQPLAINVHKSGAEVKVYVACGPLK